MPQYQVLARRYRPQKFSEVLGQEAIVTTLRNAIAHNRLAHAYLFCGSRGTGKTTLARVFAKALNCQNPTSDQEPCNNCSACKEIAAGHSLDVLEIDGASHRGIDDVRQINETVGYATTSGKYKIYIIDEVHMLTKEAFNALLKTLEEPPPKVKFFFATTEPHKVLPTILSRCQRFNLNRIPTEKIIQKLKMITDEQSIQVDEEALRLIANRAEGGLRDAESLLDQILAFHDGNVSAESVAAVLGIMPRDVFFAMDNAAKIGNLAIAFEIAHQVFSQGKDLMHFVESLSEHFRNILLIKLAGKDAAFLTLSPADRERYEQSAKLYSQEQCLTILDTIIEMQNQMRFMSSGRVALESLLLRILRIHQRIPVEFLVRRLSELEQSLSKGTIAEADQVGIKADVDQPLPQPAIPVPAPQPVQMMAQPQVIPKAPPPAAPIASMPPAKPVVSQQIVSSMTEDPTPSFKDLGIKEKATEKPKVLPEKVSSPPKEESAPVYIATQSAPIELGARLTPEAKSEASKKQSRYDTLLNFAAVELEGSIRKGKR